jgi:hypothetical protein
MFRAKCFKRGKLENSAEMLKGLSLGFSVCATGIAFISDPDEVFHSLDE